MHNLLSLCGLLTLAVATVVPMAQAADEVVVYSARKDHLIKPLFDAYTASTGVPVRFVTDKAGPLLQRLIAEGDKTPADMLITVDAGRLHLAKSLGLLQPVRSDALDASVPAHLREPDGLWYGLSVRARPVMYVRGKVDPSELSTYEATLTDPKVFTRPWTIRLTLYRLVGDDAILQQFNCVEFVEELLYGHLRKTPLESGN